MFNRKKGLKPYYRDYIKQDDGFRKYIIDSIKYLRKQGVQAAIDYDLNGFLKYIPAGLEPSEISGSKVPEAGRALVRELMDKMGFQVFADMMADMGFTKDDIETLVGEERDGKDNKSGFLKGPSKTVPGFNDENVEARNTARAEMLYNKTLEMLASIIDDALKVNNPKMLLPIVEKMEETLAAHGDKDSTAHAVMRELCDTTKVFIELIDDDQTTVEEYESFQNKLINFFVADEIESTNKDACDEHEGHDPSECEFIQKTEGTSPLQVIYKRIHAMDGTDGNKCEAIPSLSLVVLDTVRGVVIPISFSLHEAMAEKTGESFLSACKSEAGTEFLLKQLMDYRSTNQERFDRIVSARSIELDGIEASAAAIAVKPEVITPKADAMRALLDEVRETFNADAAEVFADIKPEDFLK